jgi:hypothetical protein
MCVGHCYCISDLGSGTLEWIMQYPLYFGGQLSRADTVMGVNQVGETVLFGRALSSIITSEVMQA